MQTNSVLGLKDNINNYIQMHISEEILLISTIHKKIYDDAYRNHLMYKQIMGDVCINILEKIRGNKINLQATKIEDVIDDYISQSNELVSNIDVRNKIYETGLNIVELSKIIKISRQTIYLYIRNRYLPLNLLVQIVYLKNFHQPIQSAVRIKELIIKNYGDITYKTCNRIGINRPVLFKSCMKGMPYTLYINYLYRIEKAGKN